MTTEIAANVGAEVDPKQAAEELRQFDSDLRFFSKERDQLLKEHGGKWVAIYRGKVVAIKDTPEDLVAEMQNAHVPRAHAVLDYLATESIAAY